MEDLPWYLPALFGVCVLYTFLLLVFASKMKRNVILISILWISLQSWLSFSLFYTDTTTVPPKFILALVPGLLFIVFLFISKKGRVYIDSLNLKMMYLIHVVRIPVEFGLYGLAIYKTIPMLMTFEGVNFDIFAGITAPLIILGYFYKDWLSDSFVLIWNFLSIGLLLTIVVNAITSVASPMQTQAFDQPNEAIMHFPYILLASYIVPVVLFSHFVAIKRAYTEFK